MTSLHGEDVSVRIIHLPDEIIPENVQLQHRKTVFFPIIFLEMQVTLKRLLFKPKIENLTAGVDPVRLVAQLCKTIPDHYSKTVPRNSLIPYQNDSETVRAQAEKIVKKYIYRKYPIIFAPRISINSESLLYKPFYLFASRHNSHSWKLTDPSTGEYTEISGEIPTPSDFSPQIF